VYLFALTPVDMIVTSYNVQRILAGDPAPVVQITEHPIDTQGALMLAPLLDCKDAKIREGIAALLSQRSDEAHSLAIERDLNGWTTYQIADRRLVDSLKASAPKWNKYTTDRGARDAAWNRLKDYAYQWY
jgi:hypothetical protein